MPRRLSARNPSLTSQENSYSAVIIADLVAEVEQEREADRRSSTHKEATNIHEKKPDLVDAAGCSKDATTNGTNISKGVILNALQFGQQSDIKLEKPVGQPRVEAGEQKSSIKEEFKQMSPVRKVAFGFSFVPSIMFVLCFTVIFPCEKISTCVNVQWSTSLNDTEVTSNLLVPMNVLFTFSNERESGVRSLSESSGDILWENNLTSSYKFFKCGIAVADKQACLIMDNNGTLHLFDPSDGRKIEILELKQNIVNSSLTILPDCNKDGHDEIAIAISNSQIRILSVRDIHIKDCDGIPFNLIAWNKQNGTDLIFICKNGDNEKLMKISHEEWCRTDKNQVVKMSTVTSQKAGILSQSKILPMNEGLVIWTQNFVSLFKNDGSQKWTVPSSNHSTKNRFLMNAKFRNDKKDVFLYSSDISSKLQVTRLNVENGNIITTKRFSHLELTEAVLINGEAYDFVLGLKKRFSKSLKSKAVSEITEVTTSVINILTKEEMSSAESNASTRVIEEITLMEMDGNDLQTIQSEELDYDKSKSYASSFTAVLKENLVQLFVLRKSQNSHSENLTTIKSISVSYWDASSDTILQCAWNSKTT